MVVNEENSTPPASRKKFDWKIIAGLAVVVIFLAYILFRFFSFVSERSGSSYENTLSTYYEALGKKDTNTIMACITADFANETPELAIEPGKYEIYSYHFELTDREPDGSVANATNSATGSKTGVITYSVSAFENNARVSCLLEAYLIMNPEHPRIQYIKKLYKGKNITR